MMLQHALNAQSLGFHIFPVARNAKIPHRAAGRRGETATRSALGSVSSSSTARECHDRQ